MFDWIQLAILLLKVVNGIINWAHDRGMIEEGRRQVIGEYALNIATKTRTKEQIREKVDAMSETEIDDALRSLEPAVPGAKRLST